MRIQGKAWKFGDNIDTDVIIPGRYLRTTDMSVFAKHCMEGVHPGFSDDIDEGDIIVAGDNFGCGSSREQAPLALKHAGVGCVVARSFARIFFRNAINVGLPIIEADVHDEVGEGDPVIVNLEEGWVEVNRERYRGTELPDFLLRILLDGGLVEHRRKQG